MILAKNDPPKNDPPKSEKMILTKMIFSLHRGWAPTQQQQRSMFIQWTARSTCPSTRLVKMVITSTRSLKMFIVVTSLRMLMLAIVVVDDPLKILVVDDTPFTASLPSWPDHTHCASSSKKTVTSLLKMRRSRTSLMMLTTMYIGRKRGNAPVYQAVWADNRDFDQVSLLLILFQHFLMPHKLRHLLIAWQFRITPYILSSNRNSSVSLDRYYRQCN